MAANSDNDVKTKLNETLVLNRQMQHQLLVIRGKLENVLSNVRDAYKSNELLLKEGIYRKRKLGVGIKGAYLKGGTFYLKGNMFFKDMQCRNCPNNPDYIRRREEGEMFPMDLDLQAKHVWSMRDKQAIVIGIKNQIIEYLKNQSSKRIIKNSEIDSEKLAKLLTKVPADFEIDWNFISSHNVQHRHSAKSCEAIWKVFLHPSLKRSSWSEVEHSKLIDAAKKYDYQNWQAVALKVGQRSDFQCFVQFQTTVRLPENTSKWSKEDDERLLKIVKQNTIHGVTNWSNVVANFPHKAKTTLQCRYFYSLNPKINRAPFTPEEDLLLIAAVNEYGTKFSCIPRHLFPNRTVIQLRGRYMNTLSKRHKCQPWTLEDDIKLMEFVTEYGTKEWKKCEKALNGKHTRISCRTRFTVIKRYLEKNPDASIENIPRKNKVSISTINIANWKDKLNEFSGNLEQPNDKEKNVEIKKSENQEKIMIPQNKTNLGNAKQKVTNKKRESKIEEEKTQIIPREKQYISRLKSNGIKNYNYFKYAWNFNIDHHPCDNIKLNNNNFSIVMTALRPQIAVAIQNCKLDSSLPTQLRIYIKKISAMVLTYKQVKPLPPSWSTSMGFRALCIHTTENDLKNMTSLPVINDTHNHIGKFRERLHALFYSTALLSRLKPNMVGITMPENVDIVTQTPKQNTRKRKRLGNKNDSENNCKNFCSDGILSNIKTEFET